MISDIFIRVYSRDSRAKKMSSAYRWIAPAQKQLRPLLPKTRARRQIDMSFLSDLPKRFPRSRTEGCFVQQEGATDFVEQFPAAQTTAHTFGQGVPDPPSR